MKQKMAKLLLVVCFGAFLISGCSCLKEDVKVEEPIAPPVKVVEAPPAPAPAPPPAPVVVAPVKEVPVVVPVVAPVVVLQSVYFGFDKYVLTADASDVLKKNADAIKKITSKVQIQGNCDERGSAEYNLALGENRAKTAQKYLITLGVPADRLSVISFGKEKPLDTGHNEAAWAKNRRDDLVILK
ncbi:MAG: peptidoglycan-associated lipoprotein Pal [Deltaproteobacteria bacterium]